MCLHAAAPPSPAPLQIGVMSRRVQENDSSFLTKQMKALLDEREDIQDAGKRTGKSDFLEYYVDQVFSTHVEWCRQEGRMQVEASKPRLEHMLKDTYSNLDDVLDLVLNGG